MAASILPPAFVESLPEWAQGWGGVAVVGAGALAVGLYGLRRWAAGGVNKHSRVMTGRVVLITGANTGIGLEACKTLAGLGATVVMAGRSRDRLAAAAKKVEAAAAEGGNSGKVDQVILDLSDRASVEKAAKEVKASYDRLDLLVNNAGIMFTFGRDRTEGPDGFEEQFQTNVIGHVLLTDLLLPLLEATEGSPRIINVASTAHRFAPKTMFEDVQSKEWMSGASAYGISKLGNMLHARGLNALLQSKGSRVRCYSLHPGVVNTELLRNTKSIFIPLAQAIAPLMAKTPEEGAQTTLHLCLAPDSELTPGAFYSDCALGKVRVTDPSLWTDKSAAAFTEAVREMASSGEPMASIEGAV